MAAAWTAIFSGDSLDVVCDRMGSRSDSEQSCSDILDDDMGSFLSLSLLFLFRRHADTASAVSADGDNGGSWVSIGRSALNKSDSRTGNVQVCWALQNVAFGQCGPANITKKKLFSDGRV